MVTPASKFDSRFLPTRENRYVSSVSADAGGSTFSVTPLSIGSEAQVLSALSTQSLTNVIMSGFIRDNGLVSALNRGSFYACHSERNSLEGIALIGHTILFDACGEGAIQAFAALARKNPSPHLLMGECNAVREFWNNYAVNGEFPRRVNPILFLQRHEPFRKDHSIPQLRQATHKDLDQVVRAHAEMVFETSGIDPLTKDPAGFRERYQRRIERKRVWVLMKNGRLVFKTDVTSESAEVAYLEGVYVSAEERGKGLGSSCLQAVGRILLQRKKAIYLFVENENERLQSFYFNLGFSVGGHYDLLYF